MKDKRTRVITMIGVGLLAASVGQTGMSAFPQSDLYGLFPQIAGRIASIVGYILFIWGIIEAFKKQKTNTPE